MAAPRTLTARWVFPVAGPPLPRGTVTISDDTIIAVEPFGVRKADEDLGNVALIPGLVNAHTHLDLSGARGLIPPTDPDHFTDWLRGVIAYRRRRNPEQVQADISDGLTECLRSGTTLIGDIMTDGASWDTLAAAPVRAVVYYELIGLDEHRINAAWQRSGFLSGLSWDEPPPDVVPKHQTPRCRWGISPHAPYTVRGPHAKLMFTIGLYSATHVAEAPREADLLEQRSGPFVAFLKDLGVYREDAFASSWEDFLTPYPWNAKQVERLVVHANYLPPTFPFRPEHSVVYCPRTHAAFRHPPHPFRQFLARGVRVCLGTDSLASNPDLDILAEARFVRQRYPDFSGDQILRMVTLGGAEALGWADKCGSLEVGKSADVVAVPLPERDTADPHELLLSDHPGERRTMFRGEWRSH